jgi:hypothetical protein
MSARLIGLDRKACWSDPSPGRGTCVRGNVGMDWARHVPCPPMVWLRAASARRACWSPGSNTTETGPGTPWWCGSGPSVTDRSAGSFRRPPTPASRWGRQRPTPRCHRQCSPRTGPHEPGNVPRLGSAMNGSPAMQDGQLLGHLADRHGLQHPQASWSCRWSARWPVHWAPCRRTKRPRDRPGAPERRFRRIPRGPHCRDGTYGPCP